MIDNVYQLAFLIVVSALAISLVAIAVASSINQVMKTRYASRAALREQEHQQAKEQQVDIP